MSEYYAGVIDLQKDSTNTALLLDADAKFSECHVLKDDYVNPYNYRIRIAQKLEAANGPKNDWLIIKPVEDFLKVYESKDYNTLDKGAKRLMLSSLEIMANYKFNPLNSTNPDDLNCADGTPYVERVFSLNPNYNSASLNQIKSYCEQAGNR